MLLLTKGRANILCLYYVTLLVVCLNAASIQDSGFTPTKPDESRIINGRYIDIREAPYMVQITTEHRLFLCGGTILTRWHVVTAAHCMFGLFLLEDLRIIANSTYLNRDEGIMLEIERAFIHPKYSLNSYNKDVAVLKLKEPLVFGKGIDKVDGLCVDSLKDGDEIEISGWGATGKSVTSEHLQTITTQALSHKTCAKKIKYDLTRDMFCAAVENRRDACNGDSGGPAIHNGRLCGIISWGRACGTRKPSVFTDIARVKGFIGNARKGNLTFPYLE